MNTVSKDGINISWVSDAPAVGGRWSLDGQDFNPNLAGTRSCQGSSLGRKEGMRWDTCTTTRCPRPCPTTVISTGLVHCPHGRPRPREGAREGAEQAQRRRRERRWVVTCRWRGVLNVLDDDGERAEWVVGRRSAPWTVLNGPWKPSGWRIHLAHDAVRRCHFTC